MRAVESKLLLKTDMRRSLRIVIVSLIVVGVVLMGRSLYFQDTSLENLGALSELADFEKAEDPLIIKAVLVPGQQVVEIKTGLIWQSVEREVEVNEGTKIRTDESGQAQLVFGDGSVLMLESSTEVALTEHLVTSDEQQIKIFQEIGKTWSQVEKLLSPKSSYEVETQSTVATVRGTKFGVSVDQDQGVDYVVSQGQIEAAVVKRVGAKRQVIAQAVINRDQTLHWDEVDLSETEYAYIVLSPEPIQDHRKFQDWQEEAETQLEEFQPKLERIKKDRQNRRRKKVESTERETGFLEKAINVFKSSPQPEPEANIDQVPEPTIFYASPSPEWKVSPQPMPIEPSPEVEGVFIDPSLYDEKAPLYDSSQTIDYEVLKQLEETQPLEQSDEYTLFDQQFYGMDTF